MHLIYINQKYREDQLCHVNLLNLKKLVEPVKTMREYQYPLNINIRACDETHEQGGHVSWAHFAAWPGLEAPLAIVMKKVDAVEFLCTIDPFIEPIFVSEVVSDLRMNAGLKLWYRLLNCRLKIPATVGTDKMNNRVTVGADRVFAWVKGNFTYQNWIGALNSGRTFITNSPRVSADEKFIYTSERTDNCISVLRFDSGNEILEIIERQKTLDRMPRDSILDPSGNWLLAVNQDSDSITALE